MVRHAVALAVLLFCFAFAGTAAAGRDTIDVAVRPHATLLEDGSVRVDVRVRCAPFGEAFESNLTLTQDDGFTWNQVGMAAAPCDRRWHTISTVVAALEGTFHTGPAYASAYVSRMDPESGEVRQGQATRTVRVR